jgi:hypothetical protein
MTLKGKRVAVLAENMYQEMELWVPYYRLKEEGAEVKVVGAGGAKSYTSKAGYPVNVDVQADQVSAVEFDAVVIPGGYAPDMMRRHESMVKLVREASQQGKVVAAICHAGALLATPAAEAEGDLQLPDQDEWPMPRRGSTGRWSWAASSRRGRRHSDLLPKIVKALGKRSRPLLGGLRGFSPLSPLGKGTGVIRRLELIVIGVIPA